MSSQFWFLIAGVVAAAVLSLILVMLVRRRRQADLGAVVRACALESVHRVLVPNGMGGQIEIEYLLLTAHGIIVVDTKHFEGIIFGSDRMDEWTVMTKERRFTFPNPQNPLYDRIAAIRRLVRDVPVHGHVVFSPQANFSKGRPREVMLAHEFTEQYRKPERADVERIRAGWLPYWDDVKSALEPASVPAR